MNQEPPPITRRDVLKAAVLAAGGGFLAACGRAPEQTVPITKPEVKPISRVETLPKEQIVWQEIKPGDTFNNLVCGLDQREGIYPYLGKAFLLKRTDNRVFAFMGEEAVIGAQALNAFEVATLGTTDTYHIGNKNQIMGLLEGQNAILLAGGVFGWTKEREDGGIIHGLNIGTENQGINETRYYQFMGTWSTQEMWQRDKWVEIPQQ